ncbi:MAG: hypothetical protein K0U38_06495 [Epsilonproteobacteria bacterium]|nr:hypothetical protein [Campylobacterota bacterium]
MNININIEDNQLQEQISKYISTKQKQANELIVEALKQFFQTDIDSNKSLLSEEEIKKIVTNSQRIEGYEPASKETKKRIEALMEQHNVKVSF